MPGAGTQKWKLIILGVLLILIGGGVVLLRVAGGILKGKVVEALGPGSEIKALTLGWSGVGVEGLRIRGRQGWPAVDTLRAERVVIVPSLRSLLLGQIQVGSITVTRPYLSILRTKDGKLQIVPSLLVQQAPARKPGGGVAPQVTISHIRLKDGVIELYDATVAQPPLKIRLEQIQASVRNVAVPTLNSKSRFEITGVVKGVKRDGRASISGWVEVASKDSSVEMKLQSVDLVALQPYLSAAGETRLQRGALDLDLHSEVSKNRIQAPGRVILSNLEFAPARGPLDTFMGIPRTAVVNFVKTKDDKIDVKFVVEGDINNPKFSLNEAVAGRIGAAVAENLGVTIRGVTEGVKGLGQKSLEEAAKGAGSALEQLLGGPKKR